MKRILPIFLSLTFLLLAFAGCSKPAQPNEGKFTDSQEYLIDPLWDTMMCESEDSYYYVYNNFIYVVDKETHKATVLCNKTDCLHDREQNSADCLGHLSSTANASIRFYDGKLYCTGYEEHRDNDGNIHFYDQIIRLSPDRLSRELVYETDEMVIIWFKTHRGYIYFSASKWDEQGEAGSDNAHLYRVPVSGGEPERLKIKYFEKLRDPTDLKSEGYDVIRQHFFGDYVYVLYEGIKNGKGISGLSRVKLDTLKVEEIGKNLKSDIHDFTVIGEKLYYTSGKKLYEANTDGTKEKVIKDLNSYGFKAGYNVYSGDGENVMINCYNSEDPNKNKGAYFLLFNVKAKTITPFELPYDTRIGGTPECLLLSKEEGTGSKSELYYVDKTKLNTENYCKKIYDFPRE